MKNDYSIMEETFSKTTGPDVLLPGAECFHLRLFEEANQLGTRFCVRQIYAKIRILDRGAMWEGEETDYFWSLDEAKIRYAERKLALAKLGFIYSDVDW
jgi:hypothetical protein